MEANLFPKEASLLGATVAPMDIYVDHAAGNDATGDGTALAPYKTIPRAYEDVPYRLRHYVHLHLTAGAYAAWPETVDNVYEPGGSLSFDGSSAMVDVAAGPYTIDVGGVVGLPNTYTARLTVVGGGLVASAWVGKIIEFLTGGIAGAIGAVVANTTTTVDVVLGFTPPVDGDTFKIVEPGAVVTVPAVTAIIRAQKSRIDRPLMFAGVKLDFSECLTLEAPYLGIVGSDLSIDSSDISDTEINGGYWGSVTVANILDESGWLGTWNGSGVVSGDPAGLVTARMGHVHTGSIVVTKGLDVDRGSLCFSASALTNESGDYGIDAYLEAGLSVSSAYIATKAGKPCIQAAAVAKLMVSGLHAMKGSCAVMVAPGGLADIAFLHGADASITNAIIVGQGAKVVIDGGTNDLVGASGAGHEIKWSSGAADAAYPAANAEVNDLLGAQVVGY